MIWLLISSFLLGFLTGAYHARTCALESLRVWCEGAAEAYPGFPLLGAGLLTAARECERRLGR